VVVDARPDSTVAVEMGDNSYSIDELRLSGPGELEFDFSNVDRAGHEAFVGTEDEQSKVDELRTDSNWLELGRYESGTLTVTFDRPGTYVVGCHIARHYQDGMRFDVVVS
jgi:uncharacterized cupredoxin-like copper-binding protein